MDEQTPEHRWKIDRQLAGFKLGTCYIVICTLPTELSHPQQDGLFDNDILELVI